MLLVLSCFSNVSNPIIQTCFRKDLVASLKKLLFRKKAVAMNLTSINTLKITSILKMKSSSAGSQQSKKEYYDINTGVVRASTPVELEKEEICCLHLKR